MTARKPKRLPKPPDWLETYTQRTALLNVIAKAFDPEVSDKEVRDSLIEVSQQLSDPFQTGGVG